MHMVYRSRAESEGNESEKPFDTLYSIGSVTTGMTLGNFSNVRNVAAVEFYIFQSYLEGNYVSAMRSLNAFLQTSNGYEQFSYIFEHHGKYTSVVKPNESDRDFIKIIKKCLIMNFSSFCTYLNAIETIFASIQQGNVRLNATCDWAFSDTVYSPNPIIRSCIGRLASVFTDQAGNTIRLSSNVEDFETHVMNTLVPLFNDSPFQKQEINYNMLANDVKRLIEETMQGSERRIRNEFARGFASATDIFTMLNTEIKRSVGWAIENVDIGGDERNMLVYSGEPIIADMIMRGEKLYTLPDDLVGKFVITKIAIPIGKEMTNCYAMGWNPHKRSTSNGRDREANLNKWGGLCIGDLEHTSIKNFLKIPEMLKYIFYESMYGEMPSSAVGTLFGELTVHTRPTHNSSGDVVEERVYHDTHSDGTYSEEMFMKELGDFWAHNGVFRATGPDGEVFDSNE